MNERLQSSTSYPINFFMADSTDHVSPKTGLTVTVTLSKNGAAFAACSGTVTEISNGWYSLAGNATDRNTVGELLVHAEGTGADNFDGKFVIIPWNPFDANLGIDRYRAEINYINDTNDEYSVTWFKNGSRITSGITSPTIQVIKRSDGTDLVASTAMSQIGSTASYKYDEATNKQTAGEAYLVLTSATIDGSSRSDSWLLGRDP
jgi:hypothetical protein